MQGEKRREDFPRADSAREAALTPIRTWLAQAQRSEILRCLALYLLLPNLAFLLLGKLFFIERELVNTDYLFLWLASPWIARRVNDLLYGLVFILDLALSTESIYHYSTREAIFLLRELFQATPLLFPAIVAASLVLVAALFFYVSRAASRAPHPRLPRRVMVSVLIFAFAPVVSGVLQMLDRDSPFGPSHRTATVGSGIMETVSSIWDLTTPALSGPAASATGAASSEVLRDVGQSPPYHVVVVLVESQGVLKNAADMNAVFAPLLTSEVKSRYKIRRGTVPFFGATMFGELRTLCRIYAPQATPTYLPGLERCLPHELRRRGYDTVSYHGYARWFYERPAWYPRVGLQRSHFQEDLSEGAPEDAVCGVLLRGLCDTWIEPRVRNEVLNAGTQAKFVYWVTLSSHLPVDFDVANKSAFDCAGTQVLKDHEESCGLARIHNQLYVGIAKMALDPALPPTRFLLVGDHAPPFTMLAERALYSEDRVPFIQLVPKLRLPASGDW